MDQYIEFISNHYLISLAFVVVSYMLIQDLVEHTFNKFKPLSPLLAVTKMNSADTVILDVREAHEFSKGHIEDAINIPLPKLSEKLDTLDKFKNRPLIVTCQTGSRSLPACKTLTKAGFEDVYYMTGGMQSWEDGNLPIKTSAKDKKS